MNTSAGYKNLVNTSELGDFQHLFRNIQQQATRPTDKPDISALQRLVVNTDPKFIPHQTIEMEPGNICPNCNRAYGTNGCPHRPQTPGQPGVLPNQQVPAPGAGRGQFLAQNTCTAPAGSWTVRQFIPPGGATQGGYYGRDPQAAGQNNVSRLSTGGRNSSHDAVDIAAWQCSFYSRLDARVLLRLNVYTDPTSTAFLRILRPWGLAYRIQQPGLLPEPSDTSGRPDQHQLPKLSGSGQWCDVGPISKLESSGSSGS